MSDRGTPGVPELWTAVPGGIYAEGGRHGRSLEEDEVNHSLNAGSSLCRTRPPMAHVFSSTIIYFVPFIFSIGNFEVVASSRKSFFMNGKKISKNRSNEEI